MCTFPHGFSLCPPNATSSVLVLYGGRLLMESYTSFEMTLHSVPMSNLNDTLLSLRISVAHHSSFCLAFVLVIVST